MRPTTNSYQIKRKLLRIENLEPALVQEMFALFELYYDDVTFERFQSDLKEKTHVFMFFDGKKLIGFSTIFRKTISSIGPGTFLFSGDTVIHQDYWGNRMLQKSFFWFLVSSKLRSPLRPVYWMLMSKGVKTYLMLRTNFFESYPNHLRPTPAQYQKTLDSFYSMKFGNSYSPETNLIRFKEKMGSVKSDVSAATAKILTDADSQHFYKKNPDFHEGVELACLGEIRFIDFASNVTKYFLR